jgi:hypothetical protein
MTENEIGTLVIEAAIAGLTIKTTGRRFSPRCD